MFVNKFRSHLRRFVSTSDQFGAGTRLAVWYQTRNRVPVHPRGIDHLGSLQQKHAFPVTVALAACKEFVESLSPNQRNLLRVILLKERACKELRRQLGLDRHQAKSHAEEATGLAKL